MTALRTRVLISMLSVIFCFGVAGCEPDNDVYIQNQTNQTLFVIIGDDGSWNQTAPLYPQKTTMVSVLGSGCASGKFLIADGDRNVIKRFNQVCWHATYSFRNDALISHPGTHSHQRGCPPRSAV